MKVVGLISGGKDSIHNLLHCVALGHEVVCVANLRPPEVDEMDSFMFQTVGHEVRCPTRLFFTLRG
jgi:diphthine-ammonia ligase